MENVTVTEYRELPVNQLVESITNPRRTFEESALKEMAETVRTKGIFQPLLVRPRAEGHFEVVFGARRFRAAKLAEAATVPVRIREMSDTEVLEAQLIENLQRRDVHPMEEAQGLRALLDLEEPTYSIEQIAAKTGKSPAFVAARLKLLDLVPLAVEAFERDEIGVGHALLLAKLPAEQQEPALKACFREDWSESEDRKPKRILLPVRSLQFWIEQNVLLLLKEAPFDKRDAHLIAIAGSCSDCPKRTGHNKLLFSDLGKHDACTDPTCFQEKIAAHVVKQVAAKPQLVQISTTYLKQPEGSKVLPRGQYVAIRAEKPKSTEEAKRPEFKMCRFTADAIVTEGTDVGTVRKVCPNPDCSIHHPKVKNRDAGEDAKWKAEQDKERRDAAIANATGLRVLAAISGAVPVRLMKRDLLFVAERLLSLLDEGRLTALARQHGIKKTKDADSLLKVVLAAVRRDEEGALGRLLVECSILLLASRHHPSQVLKEAAAAYKVDTDAIALKVKQEFAAKAKAKKEKKPVAKAVVSKGKAA